jgi:hypothetical protein
MINTIIEDIFVSLTNISKFKYTKKELYKFLNKSNFNNYINEDSISITPYTIFIKKQLKMGIELKNVLDLWEKEKLKY